MRVGLLVVATGRYLPYGLQLWESARGLFMAGHEVECLLFTDGETPPTTGLRRVSWSRYGWPEDTLRRYDAFVQHAAVLREYDFLWHIDADMCVVAPVGDEVVGDRTAVLHPGFVGKRGTYETRPASEAYVPPHQGTIYVCGGSGGGRTGRYLETCSRIVEMAQADRARGLVAVWHDESYLNRDAIDRPPDRLLDPSYCYPERWSLPYARRILALDKDHAEMRR